MDSNISSNINILNEYEQIILKEESQENKFDLYNSKNKNEESYDSKNENSIFGFNIITTDDVDKEILIIGFPQRKDINSIEVIIGKNNIKSSNKLKFKKEVTNKLKYIFIKSITDLTKLFFECSTLTSLDLSKFN